MERDDTSHFWSTFSPTAFACGRHFATSAPRHQPSALDVNSVRAWARNALRGSKLTPTEWARTAKLAPSTLNRFLKSESDNNLSASTLSRLINAMQEINQHGVIRHGGELTTFGIPASYRVPMIAYLDDKIKEEFEYSKDEEFYIDVPIPNDFAGFNFGVELEIDRFHDYPKGSIFVCSLATRAFNTLKTGQKFLFHQRTREGVSSSVRRLSIDPEGQRWLTRLAGDTEAKAFFFEDILPLGYSRDAFVSFLVVSTLTPEPWLGSGE